MSVTLNVLILGSDIEGSAIILEELRRSGICPSWDILDNKETFQAKLGSGIDVILVDYSYSGIEVAHVLEILKNQGFDIPVIMFSGPVSEEVVREYLRLGVADFIFHDRISRIGPAVALSLGRKKVGEEEQKTARQLRLLSSAVEQSSEGIAVSDLEGNLIFVNHSFGHMHGYSPEELIGKNSSVIHTPDQLTVMSEALKQVRDTGQFSGEFWYVRKDGSRFPGLEQNSLLRDESGVPVGVVITVRDITQRKLNETALQLERETLARSVEVRTAELMAANQELEKAAQLKDEFLANMSHELRTPLNAVLGLSEALLEEVYGSLSERQALSLKRIEESGRHLLDLINDILDISKIEAGKITTEMKRVFVDAICRSSIRMVKPDAQKKDIELSYEIDNPKTEILADQRRLKQIIVNLLVNSIKFTPEGGKVGIQVTGDLVEEELHLTVWDTGIGIPPQDIKRMFQPFVQLDSGLTRTHSGSGLGLTLVYRLVELHGGKVSVESKVNEGSRFSVILPWDLSGVYQIDIDGRLVPQTTPLHRDISSGLVKILLVEDNDVNILTISEYLEIKGFYVSVARDGIEAIKHVQEERPDIILMDVQLPKMSGIEVIQNLRKNKQTQNIPIIAVTALTMIGDRERILSAGADDYLGKPIQLRHLVDVIEKHLHEIKERETQ